MSDAKSTKSPKETPPPATAPVVKPLKSRICRPAVGARQDQGSGLLRDGELPAATVISAHDEWVEWCVFSGNSLLLATCSGDETAKVWEVGEPYRAVWIYEHDDTVWKCAFSPDDLSLCSCSTDRTVRLWCVLTGHQLRRLTGHTGSVFSCKFSPYGGMIVSCGMDETIRIWSTVDFTTIKTISPKAGPVEDVSFSPNGDYLASCGRDKCVWLWKGFLTDETHTRMTGHRQWVISCRFSPCGKYLISSSSDRTVRIWDVHHERSLRCLRGHKGVVWCSAFGRCSHFSLLVVSCSGDLTLRIWDFETGKQCYVIALQDYTHRTATKTEPVTSSEEPRDTDSEDEKSPISRNNMEAFCVNISPDFRKLALCCYDGSVFICDTHRLFPSACTRLKQINEQTINDNKNK